ncbi:MAG: glycosyltransferase, partial [Puniceicoccales bacterium]
MEKRVWVGKKQAKSSQARIALFHDFAPPPTGGGHQFLRALMAEWERMGIEVAVNCLPTSAEAVLINSYNFTPDLMRRLCDRSVRTVHRVDGPLQVYRGFDDGTDMQIARLNREFSSASIFQSEFSRNENDRLGFGLLPGPVICNAADRSIFKPRLRPSPVVGEPVRVIAASWSDNPNKGLDVFQWLDENLDASRFHFTFVGRAKMEFKNFRHIPAVPSEELATLLGDHDIFLTASLNDPCSNSVIEALTVGLPCIYRKSGGHPELI